jgi:hypothetical protein
VSDDKPKPFAVMEADPFRDEWEDLVVAGHRVASHRPAYGGALPDICAAINAAVEQREARLRGALQQVRNILAGCRDMVSPTVEVDLSAAANIIIGALGDTGADYVPAEQLRAEQAKVKALQAALDVLDTREGMTAEMVRTYLEGNGLKKPNNIVNRAAAAALLLEASNLEKRISYVSSEFGGAMRALAGELRARAKAYEATSDSTTERRPWDPLYSVGVATADLAEGQMVEVDVTNRTVSPVIVHLQRVAESHLSLCPHGHGGEMTIDVTRVTCSDCRALAAGRETPPPAP